MDDGPSAITDNRRAHAGDGTPWLLAAAAFLSGMMLARVIDWRAHAHPRL